MSEFIADDNECAFHISSDLCTPIEILKQAAPDINESDPNTILEHLKQKTDCTSEFCVIKSKKVKTQLGRDLVDKVLNNYFKVEGPKSDPEKWLSNDDIDKTLLLWKRLPQGKSFYHIPFQMRDFQEKGTELANLDFVKEYESGYRTFACVPNTDWSSGNGQHWFAMFFDFRSEPYTLEYFNSSGECPLREFNKWMIESEQRLQNEFRKKVKRIVVTRIQNQYDNSSCGCYALYYIYSRLNDIPWEWFRKNRVHDKKMHEFRRFLFNEIPDD